MERRTNYTKSSARGKEITNIVIILYVTVKLHWKTIKQFSVISHKVSIFYMLNIFFFEKSLSLKTTTNNTTQTTFLANNMRFL